MEDGSTHDELLVRLFGSVSRTRILSFLYTFIGQSFYQREVMYETGLSLRPIQRELNNLVNLGIVQKQKTRHKVYYGINRESPFFKPLRDICETVSEKGSLQEKFCYDLLYICEQSF